MLSMSAYYVVKHVPTGDCFIVLKEVAEKLDYPRYDVCGHPTVRQFKLLEFIDTDEILAQNDNLIAMDATAIGFYDAEGAFFYLYDRSRPCDTFDYDLADSPLRYVIRYSGNGVAPYIELPVTRDRAEDLVRYIRSATC